jgi:hypothetical protein
MDKNKTKIVYKVKYKENNCLEAQLDWSRDLLSNKEPIIEENKHIYLKQGEIYEFKLSKIKTTLCIILNDTNEYQENILVCPIYLLKDNFVHDGLEIGMIPEISTNFEFIAAIHEIRFVKAKHLYFKESNFNPISLGRIMKSTLVNIVYLYKSLLEKIIKMPKRYEDIHIC